MRTDFKLSEQLTNSIYSSGEYLKNNPTWHVEDSAWKARQILRMLRIHGIVPAKVCEVGCGAGEILIHLQHEIPGCEFWGYEISPQAYELCRTRDNEKLHFILGEIPHAPGFDVVLVMDVIEHLEDYFVFLRTIKDAARFKIFHIPLDLSLLGLMRGVPEAARESVGHLHYFNKRIALRVLEDCGYRVVDHFYTCGAIELPPRSWRVALAKYPRKTIFSMNQDIAATLFGGFSLLVLTE